MCSLLWPNGKGLSVVMLCIFVTVNKSNQNELITKNELISIIIIQKQ